ncbi:MAG: response regulator [Bacteriovoracaceae bacterium]|nr:response regulator [Bacteriovoracaceae bacterium]
MQPGASFGVNKVHNILVIDDESITLKMSKEGLERLGYNVAIFSRPDKALDYFSKSHNDLDLVITDKSMPKMNGVELVKQMREIDDSIPIFILTGFASNEDDLSLRKAGVTDILYKPLSIREISSKIKEILD